MKGEPYIIAIVLGILVCFITLYVFKLNQPPSIDTIWVINLDKDKERLESMKKQQENFPMQFQRWPAAYGKEEDRKNISLNDGVMSILSRSGNPEENKKSNKVLSRAGEIGCWLSHKRLLKHLDAGSYPPDFGHLICEDDIVVPEDFTYRWNDVRQYIPANWDIVYLGAGNIYGTRLNDKVIRWKNDIPGKNKNYGTYAYIVRHRSIKHILKGLKYMNSPIDVQYYLMLGDLNIYIADPVLITPYGGYGSSIDEQESR